MASIKDRIKTLQGKTFWIQKWSDGSISITKWEANVVSHYRITEIGDDYFVVDFIHTDKRMPKTSTMFAISAVRSIDNNL